MLLANFNQFYKGALQTAHSGTQKTICAPAVSIKGVACQPAGFQRLQPVTIDDLDLSSSMPQVVHSDVLPVFPAAPLSNSGGGMGTGGAGGGDTLSEMMEPLPRFTTTTTRRPGVRSPLPASSGNASLSNSLLSPGGPLSPPQSARCVAAPAANHALSNAGAGSPLPGVPNAAALRPLLCAVRSLPLYALRQHLHAAAEAMHAVCYQDPRTHDLVPTRAFLEACPELCAADRHRAVHCPHNRNKRVTSTTALIKTGDGAIPPQGNASFSEDDDSCSDGDGDNSSTSSSSSSEDDDGNEMNTSSSSCGSPVGRDDDDMDDFFAAPQPKKKQQSTQQIGATGQPMRRGGSTSPFSSSSSSTEAGTSTDGRDEEDSDGATPREGFELSAGSRAGKSSAAAAATTAPTGGPRTNNISSSAVHRRRRREVEQMLARVDPARRPHGPPFEARTAMPTSDIEDLLRAPRYAQVSRQHHAAVAVGADCYRDVNNGCVVFCRPYLQQLPCCGRQCRHCPYGHQPLAFDPAAAAEALAAQEDRLRQHSTRTMAHEDNEGATAIASTAAFTSIAAAGGGSSSANTNSSAFISANHRPQEEAEAMGGAVLAQVRSREHHTTVMDAWARGGFGSRVVAGAAADVMADVATSHHDGHLAGSSLGALLQAGHVASAAHTAPPSPQRTPTSVTAAFVPSSPLAASARHGGGDHTTSTQTVHISSRRGRGGRGSHRGAASIGRRLSSRAILDEWGGSSDEGKNNNECGGNTM